MSKSISLYGYAGEYLLPGVTIFCFMIAVQFHLVIVMLEISPPVSVWASTLQTESSGVRDGSASVTSTSWMLLRWFRFFDAYVIKKKDYNFFNVNESSIKYVRAKGWGEYRQTISVKGEWMNFTEEYVRYTPKDKIGAYVDFLSCFLFLILAQR